MPRHLFTFSRRALPSSPLVLGFIGSFTLIAAIDAQNAFVLRQGTRREHGLPVVALLHCVRHCADRRRLRGCRRTDQCPSRSAERRPFGGAVPGGLRTAGDASRVAAVVADAVRSRPGEDGGGAGDLRRAQLPQPACLSDIAVLVGALADEHRDERWLFGIGAVTASTVRFVGLGLGARRLAGLFATPMTWRILDGLIAVVMITLAVALALSYLAALMRVARVTPTFGTSATAAATSAPASPRTSCALTSGWCRSSRTRVPTCGPGRRSWSPTGSPRCTRCENGLESYQQMGLEVIRPAIMGCCHAPDHAHLRICSSLASAVRVVAGRELAVFPYRRSRLQAATLRHAAFSPHQCHRGLDVDAAGHDGLRHTVERARSLRCYLAARGVFDTSAPETVYVGCAECAFCPCAGHFVQLSQRQPSICGKFRILTQVNVHETDG